MAKDAAHIGLQTQCTKYNDSLIRSSDNFTGDAVTKAH